MRTDDFTQSIKKSALEQANYRCERCWSIRDLEFHHIVPTSHGGNSTIENCLVLCHKCHTIVPKDPFILKNYFLRFSSVKEMIQYYNVDNEDEAIKFLSQELGINYSELKIRIKEYLKSHLDTIKFGIKKRVEIIGHSGFNIPFGFYYCDGILKIIPKDADVVKDIYKWYIEGKSMGKIVKMLNSRKIQSKRGGLWAKKTISTILKNPVYCGYHRFEGKTKKGKHSKIIDKITFNKVQKLIVKKGCKPNFYKFG